MQNDYQWRSGSVYRANPQTVGKHIEMLAALNGGAVTTEIVANEANVQNSPLYDLFEHDIEVAAYEYHKAQARGIVNSLVIVTVIPADKPAHREYQSQTRLIDIEVEREETDEDGMPVTVRAFPCVLSDQGQRYYTPLQAVLSNGALRDQYAARLLQEFKSLARRAKDFRLFSDVVNAIEGLPEPA